MQIIEMYTDEFKGMEINNLLQTLRRINYEELEMEGNTVFAMYNKDLNLSYVFMTTLKVIGNYCIEAQVLRTLAINCKYLETKSASNAYPIEIN